MSRSDGDGEDGEGGAHGPLSRLALQAKAGDRAALGEFANSIGRYVLWAVRARASPALRPWCDLDDLASIAWIAILENLGRIEVRSDGQLKAWLRRVVATRLSDAIEKLRRQKRDATRQQSLDELLGFGDQATPARLRTADADHVRDLWNRIELAKIAAALTLLPDALAEAVWLVDFDGCTTREAARLAERPETSLRRDYARGKARLASILGDDPERRG
jgi:RNA polymerase sigma factor (sigma-70 family)